MCIKKAPLSSLPKNYDSYSSTGELNFHVNDPLNVIQSISGIFSEYEHDYLDGLTVSSKEWWFNLRPSNTEPLLRLNLEAVDAVIMEREIRISVGILKSLSFLRSEMINVVEFLHDVRPKTPRHSWHVLKTKGLYGTSRMRTFCITQDSVVFLQ